MPLAGDNSRSRAGKARELAPLDRQRAIDIAKSCEIHPRGSTGWEGRRDEKVGEFLRFQAISCETISGEREEKKRNDTLGPAVDPCWILLSRWLIAHRLYEISGWQSVVSFVWPMARVTHEPWVFFATWMGLVGVRMVSRVVWMLGNFADVWPC